MSIFGNVNQAPCVNVQDSRCSDPAFALANPDACPPQTQLIVKPSFAVACALGSIQFRAFITLQGVETDVTSLTTFSTSDAGVAVIAVVGAGTGNATGLTAGEATIQAAYNGMTGSATMQVLAGTDCCSARSVGMLLLVDVTKSMTQPFGGAYATREDFARNAAVKWAGNVNGTKDKVAVTTFTDSGMNTLQAFTSDTGLAKAAAQTITATTQTTGFSVALQSAIAALGAAGTDEQVLVVISDGEDEDTAEATAADDPLAIANQFKQNGGIVICLGCRASDTANGFTFLSQLATGGFFINGLPDSPDEGINYLTGLMGYVCAGDCTPDGDVMQASGELNYTGFADWIVSSGNVDLFGNGFFDLLPGNGLYVNLAGSTVVHNGILRTKTSIPVTAGHDLTVTLRIAGNQIDADFGAGVHVQVINHATQAVIMDRVLGVPNYTMPFTPMAVTFSVPVGVTAVDIKIQESDSGTPPDPRWSILLKSVVVLDATTSATLYSGDFDSENVEYIPPRCGVGTTFFPGFGYYTGYHCSYDTCLSSPPAAQSPDPNPLADIETSNTQPITSAPYTSTQQACAECPMGYVNLSQSALTPKSTSSSGPTNVGTTLSGLTWQIPVDRNTSVASDPADQTATISGDPGTTYSVLLLIRGIIELKGQAAAGTALTPVAGTGNMAGLYTGTFPYSPGNCVTSSSVKCDHLINGFQPGNEYTLEISNPHAFYVLNIYPPAQSGLVQVDYRLPIQINGGATVTLRARTIDGSAYPNTTGMIFTPGGSEPPINVNQSPYFPGQFLQMDVLSVTGGVTPSLPITDTFVLSTVTTVDNYAITNSSAAANYPTDWEVEGSNDGSTWTIIDARAGAIFTAGQTKRYPISIPAPFTQYRIIFTATSDGNAPVLSGLSLYEAAPGYACETRTVTSTNARVDAYNQAFAAAQGDLSCVHRWSSTQTYHTKCSTSGASVDQSATAYSYVSQQEADSAALATAKALALAAAALC